METHTDHLAPDVLAEGGPMLGVVPESAGTDGAARYGALPTAVLPSGVPLVVLVRTPVLASSDSVEVERAGRDGTTIDVVVAMRTYTGTLFANVPYVGLVQARLGALPPGDYTLAVTWRTWPFGDLAHPDVTEKPTVVTEQVSFQVL